MGRCRSRDRNERVHGESVFGNNWRLTLFLRAGYLQVPGCVCVISERATSEKTKYCQLGSQLRIPNSSPNPSFNPVPSIPSLPRTFFSPFFSLSTQFLPGLFEALSAFPLTYLVRQGQAELDLVGGNISVSAALDGAESVESRAGGASDTEGVHYGGAVG